MSPPLAVVMGVCGVGKSAVGRVLAARAGLDYSDGDDHHAPSNIASMAAGRALTDEDRQPWLELIGDWLADHDGSGGVISCSALRRGHRDVLVQRAPRVVFLHLAGESALILARMQQRDHFMPPSLLASQEAILEPLGSDERGATFDIIQTPEQIAADFLVWFHGSR